MPCISNRLIVAAIALLACTPAPRESADSVPHAVHDPAMHETHTGTGARDSSFAALQARGALGMGVDQYTSAHTFEPLADGGRISLRRTVDDSAGVEQIRTHMQTIAAAFSAGNFTIPRFVHAGTVPGIDVMAARRSMIVYRSAPIANGAEMVITTRDAVAIEAIHRFLAFQRREHRTGDGSDTTHPPAR